MSLGPAAEPHWTASSASTEDVGEDLETRAEGQAAWQCVSLLGCTGLANYTFAMAIT